MSDDKSKRVANDVSATVEAKNLSILLQYDDQLFVSKSYQMLLMREPDPVGSEYYLKRLRMGVSKIEIIVQLLSSNEVSANSIGFLSFNSLKLYARATSMLRHVSIPKPVDRYLDRFQDRYSTFKIQSEFLLVSTLQSMNEQYVRSLEQVRKGEYLTGHLLGLGGVKSTQSVISKLQDIENQILMQREETRQLISSLEFLLGGTFAVPLRNTETREVVNELMQLEAKSEEDLQKLSPRSREFYYKIKMADQAKKYRSSSYAHSN